MVQMAFSSVKSSFFLANFGDSIYNRFQYQVTIGFYAAFVR